MAMIAAAVSGPPAKPGHTDMPTRKPTPQDSALEHFLPDLADVLAEISDGECEMMRRTLTPREQAEFDAALAAARKRDATRAR